jgi:hypothetical protein
MPVIRVEAVPAIPWLTVNPDKHRQQELAGDFFLSALSVYICEQNP